MATFHSQILRCPSFRNASRGILPSKSVNSTYLHVFTSRRPTLDDVQRLSEGRAARSRGYGSRQVPHRLNQDERLQYNIAKERGFLTLKGSGYRRERKGSPLANIWRQLNDAYGKPCILIEQQQQGGNDTVVVDLSTLRLLENLTQVAQDFSRLAQEMGIEESSAEAQSSPFTVIVPGEGLDEEDEEENVVEDGENSISEDGLTAAEEHILNAPIWQQKPRLMFFRCERPVAKQLAKAFAAWKP